MIAKLNPLEVSTDGTKEVILKYHWLDRLVSSPPATINPVKSDDDPIPFIKVIDAPRSLF